MTKTTIRQVQGEELLQALYPLASYAFRSSPPLFDQETWMEMVRERQEITSFALFEEDNPVATVCAAQMTQNVRGKRDAMGGVWGVVTHPQTRRKGYTKRLMAQLLGAMHEQGKTFSCLYPFRESFYERLGYVTFPLPHKATFSPQALLPLLNQEMGGEIELTVHSKDLDTYLEYTRAMQASIHGMAQFDYPDRGRAERFDKWQAKAIIDGQISGLMLYSLDDGPITQFKMNVAFFHYHTSQARYLLLSWIARHIDQASQVEMWLAPYERPETWLSDLKVSLQSVERAPMGRIVDVARIGGLFSGPGQFSAHLSDPLCPWNEGNWIFESVEGVLRVSTANRADSKLTIQALAALVYGTHDPGDFAIRGWGDPSPQLQATMRKMFPLELPYLHEFF